MGLELAGIDLRIRPNGEVVCFEVNPSPAFSYYEERTGLPIAAAVARHLATA
jgi:D-alanine-D-alanine ligase-like ATP-grasp enzyme